MRIYPILSRKILLVAVFLLFLASVGRCAVGNEDNRKDLDSLRILTNSCTTDSCRFYPYAQYFWGNFFYMDKAVPAGKLAVELSKNSKNELIQSQGFDISGTMFEHLKMYDSAFYAYSKMLSISQKLNNIRFIYWSYYHLGINHARMGNTDSALYYFRKQYNHDISNQEIREVYSALNEIAKFCMNAGDLNTTKVYFDNMILLGKQHDDKDIELDAYMSNIYFYANINNTKKEVELLNGAIALAEETFDEKAQIKIYLQIAEMFFRQKQNYDVALQYYQKALDLTPPNEKTLKASILNDIGTLYLKYNKDSLALVNTQQALKYANDTSFKHQISLAYMNLGEIYFFQNKFTKAIENFKTCYKIGCDFCPKIAFHNSVISIADAYLKLNEPDKALEYYLESFKLAEEANAYNEMAISNLKLGNFFRLNKPSLSEKYYLTSFDFAERGNNLNTIKAVSDTLSTFFIIKKDFKAAYMYTKRSIVINDSIYKINQQANMANWELKFEIEKINQANAVSVEEIKRQKTFRNSLLIITLLLIGFGFVIYVSYRRKKNDNKLLTEQKKQIEDKNQEIQAQVEEITAQKDEIVRISDELHEADEMKLRFFANVSHELRTPLTLILNPVKNLLETSPYSGEHKKQLEYILSNALKLQDLTNQIMDLQKLDAGKLQLNIEQEDIIHYCVGLISSFESLCEPKNVTIHVESNISQAIAGFDKDKIGKILTNLLSNAIKFCFTNSVIHITITVINNRLCLKIDDKGAGIPASEVKDVFRRYKQASNNRNTGGTGLGLAYVHELATFMNGVVSLESEENIGTTVTAEIPVAVFEIKDHTRLNIEIANKQKLQTPRSFDLKELTNENSDQALILIVEDNDQLRDYIAKLFQPEYNIILANDGQAGIELAIKHTPDIIISDVMMPIMNGFALCTAIKNDEHTSHIPVLLLTAKDTDQSYREGYETGADDYILKPFDNELLKLKVRNVIATHDAARRQFDFQSILAIDNLKLGNTDKEFMKKCLAVVEKNIDNSTFGVDQLAEALAFSSRNFYRKIQSLTSQTPAELIRIYRLHYAKQLLQKTDMRVSEIAGAVGYDDVKRFSQAFKKQFDVLPSEMFN